MEVTDERQGDVVNIEREALVILGERGWCKRRFEDEDGRVCMGRALSLAAASHGLRFYWTDWDNINGHTKAVIREQYPELGVSSVMTFNDASATTWEDVEKVLLKASIRRDEAAA